MWIAVVSPIDIIWFHPHLNPTRPALLSQDWLVGYKVGQRLDRLGVVHIDVASSIANSDPEKAGHEWKHAWEQCPLLDWWETTAAYFYKLSFKGI